MCVLGRWRKRGHDLQAWRHRGLQVRQRRKVFRHSPPECKAHNKATTQPSVYQSLFDKDGAETSYIEEAQKVEWYVKPYNSSKYEHTIQTYP